MAAPAIVARDGSLLYMRRSRRSPPQPISMALGSMARLRSARFGNGAQRPGLTASDSIRRHVKYHDEDDIGRERVTAAVCEGMAGRAEVSARAAVATEANAILAGVGSLLDLRRSRRSPPLPRISMALGSIARLRCARSERGSRFPDPTANDPIRWRAKYLDDDKRQREREMAAVCEAMVGRAEGSPSASAAAWPQRSKVLALVAFVMCLCNADRVVMSVAVVPLAARYGWSSSFLGVVQSSFLWGYLVSSIVGGALADRYGGKRVLAWGVAVWSIATFLTPSAADHSTVTLLAVRTIFGLAEGVALPCMNTILSRWFPIDERASSVGLSMAGFQLGNVISFLSTPLIISNVGLNGPFVLFAALGFLWLSLWTFYVADDPRESLLLDAAELQIILAGKDERPETTDEFPSVRHLFSKLPTWALVVANVTNNWGYFVLLSWMPVYFKTVYNVNLKEAAWLSATPYAMAAICGYIAGASSDLLIRSGHTVTRVRKIMQSIGFVGPAMSLLFLKYAKTPTTAAALMTTAVGLSTFSQAGFLLNMQDIAPKCAGFLHGISNGIGTFAAILSTIGTGYFVQWVGSFQAFLTLTAALYLIAAVFWNIYATGEQVFF